MNDNREHADERALHRRVIVFFREEVDRRYRLEYLEAIPGIREEELLEGLDQETIDQVKSFFQEVLYPAGEERSRRDESVEAVVDILNSRGRLLALLPRMPGFVLKYGGSLVTAARAGLEVLDAFRHSMQVEREVIANLRELCKASDTELSRPEEIPDALLRRAFAELPDEQTEEMIAHLKKLTELGMRRKVVDATLEVLRAIRELIASEKEEEDAIAYAVEVMEQLDGLVRSYRRRTLKRFVWIAEYTERQYLRELAEEL
jgi:hypothetical protein